MQNEKRIVISESKKRKKTREGYSFMVMVIYKMEQSDGTYRSITRHEPRKN